MEVNDNSAHRIGNFIFSPATRQLYVNEEQSWRLTWKESQLLDMLAAAAKEDAVLPRDKALMQIWQKADYFTSRSMDVYITKLRKFLKADPNIEIINYHGKGFKLIINQA